jgi:hypothetical protein
MKTGWSFFGVWTQIVFDEHLKLGIERFIRAGILFF